MTSDLDGILDDLLSRWHTWSKGESMGRGHSRKALVCGDFKISRQYDDTNGQLDADLESQTMRQVNFRVSTMDEPYKAAIHTNARACVLGILVFISPRLPADKTERQAIVTKARALLIEKLIQDGVI